MPERPTPPAVGTEEYDRWKRSATINFTGGYLEAAYGNLVQTFGELTSAPISGTRSITRKAHSRTNKIGGESTNVAETTFTEKIIPRRNASGAAAGQPITVITPVGSYTARLGGSIEDFVSWVGDSIYVKVIDTMTFASERGAVYGPFVNPMP